MRRLTTVFLSALVALLPTSMCYAASFAGSGGSPWMRVSFDPQPEPPGYALTGWTDPEEDSGSTFQFQLSIKDFDPQPEPPGFGIPISFLIDDDGLEGGTLSAMSDSSGIRITAYDASGLDLYTALFAFSTFSENNLSPTSLTFVPAGAGAANLTSLSLVAPNGGPLSTTFWFLLTTPPSTVGSAVTYFRNDTAVATFSLQNAGGANLPLSVVPDPVPEPGTILLLGSGLVGLAGYGRKRKK